MDGYSMTMTAIAITYFVSMGWAVRGHFQAGRMPRGMAATTALTALAFAWFLEGRWEMATGRAAVPDWADAAASAIIIADLGLFWLTVNATRQNRLTLAFSPDIPSFIVASGPYRLVRHPFYLSYLIFWSATALGSASSAYWLVPFGLAILYVGAAGAEEKKFASSPLAAEYNRYRARTGMMMPSFRRTRQTRQTSPRGTPATPTAEDARPCWSADE